MPGHALNIRVSARVRERVLFVRERERVMKIVPNKALSLPPRERERVLFVKSCEKKKKEGKRVMPAHMRHQRSRLPKKNKKKGQKWNTTGALGVASFESREKKEKKRKKSTTCALGVASFDRFGLEGPQPLHHLFQQLCLC